MKYHTKPVSATKSQNLRNRDIILIDSIPHKNYELQEFQKKNDELIQK